MPIPHQIANPFALLMNPEAVIAAMERSSRLNHLQSRVCRPLDKPLIPHSGDDADSLDDDADLPSTARD